MSAGAWPAVGPGGRLVALVTDLMDRSRISAARPEVSFLRGPAELAGLGEHDVALVDLARPGVIEALGGCRALLIGFVAHVDEVTASAATAAGVAEVLARSVFFRRLANPS